MALQKTGLSQSVPRIKLIAHPCLRKCCHC